MTNDEAIEVLKSECYVLPFLDGDRATLINSALDVAIEAMEKEPREDCISRKAALNAIQKLNIPEDMCVFEIKSHIEVKIATLPSVIPQPETGHWLRMSDLSEQEDDRYKCSRCGNVVHHTNKMNLYTFNSWCGRCGSDNGRKRGQE